MTPNSAQPFSPEFLAHLNARLCRLASPQEILKWAVISVPNLVQTTAFGLTGLAITDMIAKLSAESIDFPSPSPPALAASSTSANAHLVPIIFIDTLYHFKDTLDLADRVAERYGTSIHIYKPLDCPTTAAFEAKYGEKAWETKAEVYDFAVKVEPARRAYEELGVEAVITGRRRSQKGERSEIPILEMDTSGPSPILKINVLAFWNYEQVWEYIKANNVPYNVLHDQGYKSIGDWHSTQPTGEGQGEREGRWAGQEKTECGLHKDYFAMKAKLKESSTQ